MVFWIAILVGCITLYLATRMGFFDTLVLSFNILTSIYVGIYSACTLIDTVPATANFVCGVAITVSAISLICFLSLSGLSYVLLTGQFKVSFPKAFDVLLAGLLGCCTGVLLVSYLVFILSILPPLKTVPCLDKANTKANIALLCLYCDQVQGLVAPRDNVQRTQNVLAQIKQHSQENVPSSNVEIDPNQ
jgi:hypothetical protein